MNQQVVSADIAGLTEDERMEYAEIGQFHRHDDTIAYQLGAVLLPLSFGAVALAAQFPDMRYWLAGFSITIYLYWHLVSARLAWFTDVRRTRVLELEKKAGLRNHRAFEDIPPHLACKCGRHLSIRRMRLVFFVLLTLCWVALLVWMA